jgi:colanic acid/amylovoran biosynthesis glycosyltransferase
MKIALLIPNFPSQTHAFFWREYLELRKQGVHPLLVSSRRPAACPHEFAHEARARTHYLIPPRLRRVARHLHRLHIGMFYATSLPESGLSDKLRICAMAICAADLLDFCFENRIDHIHVHSCADIAHVAAMCRLMGGPQYSLRLHGDLPVYGRDHRAKMTTARFVCAVARPMQEQVIGEVGIPKHLTCVVPMGIDTGRICPGNERSFRGSGETLRLVSVARLNSCKGHLYALHGLRCALDAGASLHYTIAGSGEAEAEIRRSIAELNLADQVDMVGSLSEDQVLRLLQCSDLFMLTSVGIGEASPVAVMEAMACGLPVVCSIIGGTPDMIEHQVDGILVPQKDEQAIAEAIAALARDPVRRRQMSLAARQKACERFSVKQTVDALLTTIRAHYEQ